MHAALWPTPVRRAEADTPSSWPGDDPILAFSKADDTDRTHIMARGLPGDVPANRLTIAAWYRPKSATLSGARGPVFCASGGDVTPPDERMLHLLQWQGTTTPDQIIGATSQNGSPGVYRSDTSTYIAGDITDTWHTGFYTRDDAPNTTYTYADDVLTAATAAAGIPSQDTIEALELFRSAGAGTGSRVMSGLIASPLFLHEELEAQAVPYYAARGRRVASLWDIASLRAAPRPRPGRAGSVTRSWALTVGGVADNQITVRGVPATYAGVGLGFDTDDNHYFTGSLRTGAPAARTVIVTLEGLEPVPGGSKEFFGRGATTGSGIRMAIFSDGIRMQFSAYQAGGGASVFTLNLTVAGVSLGDRLHYYVTIAADGLSGTVGIYDDTGVERATSTLAWTPSAAVFLQNFVLGRGVPGGGLVPYTIDQGTIYRLNVFAAALSPTQLSDWITQTGSPPLPYIDIAGVDSNIVDDADAARGDGERRLWGVLDRTNVYGDVPKITRVGREIVVGS